MKLLKNDARPYTTSILNANLIILINNDLDIEFNKKRRDARLIARRFEDILSSLSSDRKNSVLKFKGANIQYDSLHEQFCP